MVDSHGSSNSVKTVPNGKLRLSKNTLYIHVPQHLVFLFGLGSIVMGQTSAIWLLYTYLSWIVLGYFGFSVFYHRYFAHRAFQTHRLWEIVWGYLGLLVGRGSPINMASLHCGEHHRFADRDGDPHSPRQGKLWSWVLWAEHHQFKISAQHSKHLIRDKYIRFLDLYYLRIFWGTFLALLLIDWRFATFCMMGAGVVHFHVEGAVSTFCHLPDYGRQDFATNDDSRNIRGIFNLLLMGTGLHNSHHAFPRSYHYAVKDGDFDLAKYVLPVFIRRSPEDSGTKHVEV